MEGGELMRRLAERLGADDFGGNFVVLSQGSDQLRLDNWMTGDVLGFTLRCSLEAAEAQVGTGYRGDPRPRIEGRPKLVLRRETTKDQQGKR